MTSQNTLWVIDDDPALRLILEDTFTDAGLDVRIFANAQGAWATLNDVLHNHQPKEVLPDVILTDIRMPMMDGLSFSEWVHEHFADIPIIIMTAHSDLKSAVDSYQTGAFDYLPKPFDLDEAVTIIEKAIKPKAKTDTTTQAQESALVAESQEQADDQATSVDTKKDSNKSVRKKSSADKAKPTKTTAKITKNDADQSPQQSSGIIGQSVAMQTVFRAIGRLSKSPITVLITGESGTGKELVAHALHQHSPRNEQPFIALNMAALPHDLIESELFGHEKGAFTGATTQRQGRFEQASGGTLFLDEIGDMPFSTQTRLLRVLANGEFFRVGGHKPIKVDVRIIAATHQDLEMLVKQGKFREDLFYRLNVIRLPLPPLRARRDDIPALVEFFMKRAAIELNSEEKTISAEAMQLMQAFDWSGNVRQLENACRWITVMATGDVVFVDDLPPELTDFAERWQNSQNAYQQSIQGANNYPTPNAAAHSLNATNHVSHHDYSNDGLSGNDGLGGNAFRDYDRQSDNAYRDYHDAPPTHSNQNSHSEPDTMVTITNGFGSSQTPPTTDSSLNNTTASASKPLPVSSEYFDSLKPTVTWQNQLKNWADKALSDNQTEALQKAFDECERVLIEIALEHTKGRKGEAAELLGWGRNTLTRKLKQLTERTTQNG